MRLKSPATTSGSPSAASSSPKRDGAAQLGFGTAALGEMREVEVYERELPAVDRLDAQRLADTPLRRPADADAAPEAELARHLGAEAAVVEHEPAMRRDRVPAGDEHGVCLPCEGRAQQAVVEVRQAPAETPQPVARPCGEDGHPAPRFESLERPQRKLLETQHVRIALRRERDGLL